MHGRNESGSRTVGAGRLPMVATLAVAVAFGAATAAPVGADDSWNDGWGGGTMQAGGWDDTWDDDTWDDGGWSNADWDDDSWDD